jgi:hypothetical protein
MPVAPCRNTKPLAERAQSDEPLSDREASTALALDAAERAFAAAHEELERVRTDAAAQRRERMQGGSGQAEVQHLDGTSASANEILEMLRRDGATIIENFASPAQVATLDAELTALEPFAHRAEPGSFSGENTVSNGPYLVAACPTAQELALHPVLTDVIEGMLSPYARRVALAVASEINISGAGPAQVLHRDDEEWPLDLSALKKPGAELELNSMWAVSDFVKESGATQVAPGSHRWPAGREPQPDEVAIAEMPKGSVLLWLGSTLHGAGASTPDCGHPGGPPRRHGMLLGFCLSWLRPEMNMHWSCPPSVAASLDPRVSTLLGFAGSDRYGAHPYKVRVAFATEYNGYPGDEVDYGAATTNGDADWTGAGRDNEHSVHDSFAAGDLAWLTSHAAPKL